MRHPVTVFDRPRWKLLPDPKSERYYGNVPNRLEIVDGRKTWAVAIAVPTELFTLLREVWHVDATAHVSLHLDAVEVDHRRWFVLAVFVQETQGAQVSERLFDLWSYPKDGIPKWMSDPQYRLA